MWRLNCEPGESTAYISWSVFSFFIYFASREQYSLVYNQRMQTKEVVRQNTEILAHERKNITASSITSLAYVLATTTHCAGFRADGSPSK